MRHRFVVTVLMVASMGLGGPEAFAQQASSFEQLQVLVKVGDSVSVADAGGTLTRGRIAELTRSSLRLQTDQRVREFSESDVAQITQRRSDSLANGARIGAFTGLGLGILGVIAVCNLESCGGGGIAAAVGVYAALGAGIGVGIDAMIVRETTVYRPRPAGASSRITLLSDFKAGRKGVLLSLSF